MGKERNTMNEADENRGGLKTDPSHDYSQSRLDPQNLKFEISGKGDCAPTMR